jgi:PAS domain S-box-containing protein
MKRVLIVDDIEDNRYLLESLVKGYGFSTVSANNGAEALGLAKKSPPDIIISDILMPVMDGYSLCREWKKDPELKNIPFVFYTATYTHPKDEEFALSLGAEKFLIKPQEPDYFISVINQVLIDFKADNIELHKPSDLAEINHLKQYNETLIRKMEDRMLKSEESEKKIREYAERLEKEIEEKNHATLALKESEARFRSYFELSNAGISITSPDKGWVDVNDHLCEMLGYSKEELQLLSWADLTHPEDLNNDLEHFNQVMAGKSNGYSIDKRFIHKNKSIVWVNLSVRCVRRPDFTVNYFVALMFDISERKLAEEKIKMMNEELEKRVAQRTMQLQAANKELETFSYSVSHDLRAPLRAISGFTRILSEDYKKQLDTEGQRICKVIAENTQKMGQLIEDILKFSRFGKAEMSLTEIDMFQLANSVFLEITTEEDRKKISFRVEQIPSAKGDRNLIKQVWINLISNAVKFSSKKEKAVINIGSNVEEKSVVYFINDNGVGFDMNYAGKLFNVFQRMHTSEEFEGTGVGLAIVKHVINRHNGKVWLQSEPDKGTTLFFSLPGKD